MKWLFVEKGTKHKHIFFVACNEEGKPLYAYDDMNLAAVHEKNSSRNKFTGYTVSDFMEDTKKKVNASWTRAKYVDNRPIIKMKDFGKILKKFGTEVKL